MNISDMIDQLIEVTKEKKEHLQQILGATERQSKFLELNKIKTVNKLNALKKDYMTKVDELDIRFFAIFNELKTKLNIDSFDKIDAQKYPAVKELKSNVGEILELIKKTKAIEDQNISSLREDKDKLGSKLKDVKQTKKINNAYGHDRYRKMAGSVLFDKKL